MKQGIFLTFEGNDGSGKTTVCKAIYDRLKEQGYDVIYTVNREVRRLRNPFVIFY